MEEATDTGDIEVGDGKMSSLLMPSQYVPCDNVEGIPFQNSSRMLTDQLSIEQTVENSGNVSNNVDLIEDKENGHSNLEIGANLNVGLVFSADGNNCSDGSSFKTHGASDRVKCGINGAYSEIYSSVIAQDDINVMCSNVDVSITSSKSCNRDADAINKDLMHSGNISCGGFNRPGSTCSIANGSVDVGENRSRAEVKDELDRVTSQTDEETKPKVQADLVHEVNSKDIQPLYNWERQGDDGSESGTEEERAAFIVELENFYKERKLEFKAPKFYGEVLNCLKLWRAVIRLGGYDQVTSGKLWRQVGESFKPPKTCTTVSWTFRCFYEKTKSIVPSGRTRRDAAARAMQGWHSQRLLRNGDVSDPIIKDKNSSSTYRREKQMNSIGLLKRKKASLVDRADNSAYVKAARLQLDSAVVDIGPSADWVKVNVHKTKDCFEIYALVPGLLREEVHVQSDPAGRLVISGQPELLDNPWGVAPFKKVVSLSSRIDAHQTSAVVTLHGQLFVRVPFEQSDA